VVSESAIQLVFISEARVVVLVVVVVVVGGGRRELLCCWVVDLAPLGVL